MIRKICHRPDLGVSFGFDIDGDNVSVAFAFCNPRDRFVKRHARAALNGRLDASRVISGNTGGRTPGQLVKDFNDFLTTLTTFFGRTHRRVEGARKFAEITLNGGPRTLQTTQKDKVVFNH